MNENKYKSEWIVCHDIPHCCPVCAGNGLVPNGFYSVTKGCCLTTSSITPEKCKSCDGTGIVWSRADNPK